MIRRSIFGFLLAVAAFSMAVAAQSGTSISGTIELEKAGAKAPLVGAKVDLFRTDVVGQGKSTVTGPDGKFELTDLDATKVYLLSVSAAGAAPFLLEEMKPGMTSVLIVMGPGDGRSVTEVEVKKALETAMSQMSEADRKKQAELLAKRREVEDRNKRITETTKTVSEALKAGSAAYDAKNYDLAIAKFDEGYQAEPNFVGMAPLLLNNKGLALNARAVDKFNTNAKIADAVQRSTENKAVGQDLSNAVDAFARAWELLTSAQPTEINDKAQYDQNKASSLGGVRESIRLMVATEKIDDTKTEIAKKMLGEYMATQPDKARKSAAHMILADFYRVAGNSEGAIAEYKSIMAGDPSNLDAMAGLGISMVNEGYIKDDKAMLQEGANVLQQYATAAPANHKYKDDALGLIEVLKTQNNIAPQKTTPARRRN